jgi:S1-C subfamily serine protease
MKNHFAIRLLLLIAPLAALAETISTNASTWEKSVVNIEVARKSYDYYQPWNRRSERAAKTGVVVGERQILATAQGLSDQTLVRMQKNGRGKWATASVVWIDYHANLALLTTEDAAFWRDLRPADLTSKPPAEGAKLQIVRWREGKLENRQAEFTQYSVNESVGSAINHVQMELDSEIRDAGSGEPVITDSRVAGITASQLGRTCKVITASFIHSVVDAHKSVSPRVLGYFHFYWQPAENPASLAQLKLSGEPRGVLVINVPERLDGVDSVLKPRDIILNIDGFDLDMQGDYIDPEFGSLTLENLSTRGRWAGDDMKMKIWRDGKPLDVMYRLPGYDFKNSLVPIAVHDQMPDYLIVGGLVFQPLTTPYLQRWGSEWERTAPFRLNHYRSDEATKAKPSLVILSQVLPDKFNIGYQEYRSLVVSQVNGQTVNKLADLQAALKKPKDKFHIIDFVPNESLQRIVLAAGDTEREATQRILKRFGIADAEQITSKSAAGK